MNSWTIRVSVATLWKEPGIARRLDAPAISRPADPAAWTAALEPDLALRTWLHEATETQALLGTQIEMLEHSGSWTLVAVPDQGEGLHESGHHVAGYEGWVPTDQILPEPLDLSRGRVVVTDRLAPLAREDGSPLFPISVNTELPLVDADGDRYLVELPQGAAAVTRAVVPAGSARIAGPGVPPLPRPSGADLVSTAESFLGLRYLWAGLSGFGVDCSGLAHVTYRRWGILLPRDAHVQARGGRPVARESLEPGDLVFFADPGGTGHIHHVGMYHGDGAMIHPPNSGGHVRIQDIDEYDTKHEYAAARRYLDPA